MTKLLAIIIVIFWITIGIIGAMKAKKNIFNVEMIIFISCTPFFAFLLEFLS